MSKTMIKVFLCLLLLGNTVVYAALYKPMIFYPPQGKFDKSFGASAYRGVKAFHKNFSILNKAYHKSYTLDKKLLVGFRSPTDSASYAKMLIQSAKAGYNPIIMIGWTAMLVIPNVVNKFPNTTFVLIDGTLSGYKNLVSIQFKEEEGSYLVGILSAKKSKTKKVGVVAGMKLPAVDRFLCGYTQGVKGFNTHIVKNNKQKMVTLINPVYIGNTEEAFQNIGKAKTIAINLYNDGADVVFGVAGLATTGVLQASNVFSKNSKNVYSIGVDSNQDNIAPGHVITSIIKGVNIAVYESLVLGMEGKLKNYGNTTIEIGLSGWPHITKLMPKIERKYITQPGFMLTTDRYNKKIYTKEDQRMILKMTKSILNGKIKVHKCL